MHIYFSWTCTTIFYVKSLHALGSMTDGLLHDMNHIRLSLHGKNTNLVRCNPNDECSSINFIEVLGPYLDIGCRRFSSICWTTTLHISFKSYQYWISKSVTSGMANVAHTHTLAYIYIYICMCVRRFTYIYIYIYILLDRTVCLGLVLDIFTASVGPALLRAIPVLPMMKSHPRTFDKMQRKMLRRIIGWRRIDGDNMYVVGNRDRRHLSLMRLNIYIYIYIYNHVHTFCYAIWLHYRRRHCIDILSQQRISNFENEYVAHMGSI